MESVEIKYQTDVYGESGGTKYVSNHLEDTTRNENRTSPPRIAEVLSFNRYCPHCNLNFDDKLKYEHHNIEMHSLKKGFVCEFCQTVFRRHNHLKRHIQSLHSNQKCYHCPVCDKDCKREDEMLKHIKQNHATEEEVFHCRDFNCAYQCNTMTALQKHENSHLLTERYVCPHCNTIYKRKDHMVRHVKSQHLNQLVVCPICQQTYKRKDHVVRHVREKHRMGYLNGKLVKSADIL